MKDTSRVVGWLAVALVCLGCAGYAVVSRLSSPVTVANIAPSSPSTVLSSGKPAEVGMNNDLLQRIDDFIAKGINGKAFPGAVVLVARHGVVVKESAYGYAAEYLNSGHKKMQNPILAKTNTIFDLASLSKLFTATAAMKLVEEGKLNLDAPVARYIPEFAQRQKGTVTIRMLLTQPWYMGALASPETMGHTGFTGTSIVVDTRDDTICILLTNRVHPTRNGPSVNEYRAGVADAVAQALE